MPLITSKEIGEFLPPLAGKAGQAICRLAMRVLAMDKINNVYDRLSPNRGAECARAFLEDQRIEYSVGGFNKLQNLPRGAFITISNHPYGHVDGISLVDLFGHLRSDFKVMVNSILSRIETMDESFIPVVPIGDTRTAPHPDSICGVRAAMRHLAEGHPMGFFPSGAVSDLSLKEGCIRDRQWQEPALRLIRRARVPIIPVRFFDRNSYFYYMLGLLSSSVRLLRLPAEALNKGGKPLRIGIGDFISVDQQDACGDLHQFGELLRMSVYGMEMPKVFIHRDDIFPIRP